MRHLQMPSGVDVSYNCSVNFLIACSWRTVCALLGDEFNKHTTTPASRSLGPEVYVHKLLDTRDTTDAAAL